MPAQLLFDDGTPYDIGGRLLFSEATVDSSTGQIVLRGEFPNPKGELLPGMYVQASLVQGIDTRALLVPQQGIDRSSAGKPTALVVDETGHVAERRVTLAGATEDNRWRVRDGLAAGDRLIVQGMGKVEPGRPSPLCVGSSSSSESGDLPEPEPTPAPADADLWGPQMTDEAFFSALLAL